jgi:hypothetical protein
MQAVIIRSYRFVRNYDDDVHYSVERSSPELTPTEARQGVISGRVLLVLSASLGLAAIAGVILLVFNQLVN